MTLPFAASLQMFSSFALTLAETAAWVTPARQAATAAWVIWLFAPETDAGVEIVGVGEVLAVLVVLELRCYRTRRRALRRGARRRATGIVL